MSTATRKRRPPAPPAADPPALVKLPLAGFRVAFATAARAVPGKTHKSILRNVRLDLATDLVVLRATDLAISIRCETACTYQGEPVSLLLPEETMTRILRTADGEELGLAVEDQAALVSCRSARWTVRTEDPALFPDATEFEQAPEGRVDVEADRLALLIRRTLGETRDAEERGYTFNGLQAEPMLLAFALTGCNGRSLAHQQVECSCGGVPPSLPSLPILPAPALKVLARLLDGCEGTVAIGFDPNRAQFRLGDTTFTCRLLEGRFPRWQDARPGAPLGTLSAAVGPFREALARASVYLSEETRRLDLEFDEGELTISSSSAESGSSTAELPIAWQTEYPGGVEVSIDPQYLGGMLRGLGDETTVTVDVHEKNQPLVLRTDDGFYGLIMPMTKD